MPGGRGAPVALPAPRGDPGPPPAGPRGAAPARPELASRRAGRGRAGDGTKAPLLSGCSRRVTHNGGSRLRRRRRARRGALPSSPAGAPCTRTHTYSRDFSDSSRECGAHGQSPVSAQVSGCAGGSGVSEALALPQSPPCNPDPRERARKRGRGFQEPRPLTSQAHSTGAPAPAPAPDQPRAPAGAGISNVGVWVPRGAGAAVEARGLVRRLAWGGVGWGGLDWARPGGWRGGKQTGPLRSTCPSIRGQSDQTLCERLLRTYYVQGTGQPRGIGHCPRLRGTGRLDPKIYGLESSSHRTRQTVKVQVLRKASK